MSNPGATAAERLRAALVPGGTARRAGRSRGVSYAPADVARRLRRVAALRATCLRLRAAGLGPESAEASFSDPGETSLPAERG